MTAAYSTIESTDELFREADEQYAALKEELASAKLCESSHSDVEKQLETRGRELLRVLYQSHLRLRKQAEPVVAVVGEDGVERTQRRDTSRGLTSIFGTVDAPRTGYSTPGAGSRFPLDAELNLPPDKYSFVVRRRVAQAASSSSFDDVVDTQQRAIGAKLPKRQAEELVVKAAQDFELFYESTALAAPPKETADLLVMTFDMKGIVIRKEDLRPATRRAAERKQHKLRKRLTSGEKRNRKRMAMVAAVYTIDPWVRTPEDIMRSLGPARDAGAAAARPKPEYKRVWASVARNGDAVIREAFDEALSRDPELKKRWVVLVDGDPTQLRYLRRFARELDVELTLVLDVIHMIEYLWKAAHGFHGAATEAAEEWVSERLLRMLQGKVSTVAAGMRRSATRRKLVGAKRKAVDKCADYLLKYKDLLAYDRILADGLPIGTGVIEGACRHLVRDRMDITGARLRLERAEAVLKIRALRSSGDFDEYWDFHEQQEFARNHASRYAGQQPPALRNPANRGHLRVVK